ncbi:hypothetical protein VOLCADRAFT_92783 [Volvox carteri f. nagariensis]|uniref:Uncharacterized protein n=1 Tax=Volvox carteri f. nagariensis TaxID=3068 RepID=D8U0G7_VOLCA|nr:uncharacterized protein VOLCADRAFT_92783 [Volvox carteri f. nagariensis]EFJ46718.1 hypothetical protein VOLCADRAFT_92783 [Volvox carteri f. nagariensis]|eukprot:XP_002952247.1 hypothetical protein VOLCADRAFT_92783 [Volvox carteri f. nagariensis]
MALPTFLHLAQQLLSPSSIATSPQTGRCSCQNRISVWSLPLLLTQPQCLRPRQALMPPPSRQQRCYRRVLQLLIHRLVTQPLSPCWPPASYEPTPPKASCVADTGDTAATATAIATARAAARLEVLNAKLAGHPMPSLDHYNCAMELTRQIERHVVYPAPFIRGRSTYKIPSGEPEEAPGGWRGKVALALQTPARGAAQGDGGGGGGGGGTHSSVDNGGGGGEASAQSLHLHVVAHTPPGTTTACVSGSAGTGAGSADGAALPGGVAARSPGVVSAAPPPRILARYGCLDAAPQPCRIMWDSPSTEVRVDGAYQPRSNGGGSADVAAADGFAAGTAVLLGPPWHNKQQQLDTAELLRPSLDRWEPISATVAAAPSAVGGPEAPPMAYAREGAAAAAAAAAGDRGNRGGLRAGASGAAVPACVIAGPCPSPGLMLLEMELDVHTLSAVAPPPLLSAPLPVVVVDAPAVQREVNAVAVAALAAAMAADGAYQAGEQQLLQYPPWLLSFLYDLGQFLELAARGEAQAWVARTHSTPTQPLTAAEGIPWDLRPELPSAASGPCGWSGEGSSRTGGAEDADGAVGPDDLVSESSSSWSVADVQGDERLEAGQELDVDGSGDDDAAANGVQQGIAVGQQSGRKGEAEAQLMCLAASLAAYACKQGLPALLSYVLSRAAGAGLGLIEVDEEVGALMAALAGESGGGRGGREGLGLAHLAVSSGSAEVVESLLLRAREEVTPLPPPGAVAAVATPVVQVDPTSSAAALAAAAAAPAGPGGSGGVGGGLEGDPGLGTMSACTVLFVRPGPGGVTALHLAALMYGKSPDQVQSLMSLCPLVAHAWFTVCDGGGNSAAQYALRAGAAELNSQLPRCYPAAVFGVLQPVLPLFFTLITFECDFKELLAMEVLEAQALGWPKPEVALAAAVATAQQLVTHPAVPCDDCDQVLVPPPATAAETSPSDLNGGVAGGARSGTQPPRPCGTFPGDSSGHSGLLYSASGVIDDDPGDDDPGGAVGLAARDVRTGAVPPGDRTGTCGSSQHSPLQPPVAPCRPQLHEVRAPLPVLHPPSSPGSGGSGDDSSSSSGVTVATSASTRPLGRCRRLTRAIHRRSAALRHLPWAAPLYGFTDPSLELDFTARTAALALQRSHFGLAFHAAVLAGCVCKFLAAQAATGASLTMTHGSPSLHLRAGATLAFLGELLSATGPSLCKLCASALVVVLGLGGRAHDATLVIGSVVQCVGVAAVHLVGRPHPEAFEVADMDLQEALVTLFQCVILPVMEQMNSFTLGVVNMVICGIVMEWPMAVSHGWQGAAAVMLIVSRFVVGMAVRYGLAVWARASYMRRVANCSRHTCH